MSLSLKSAPRPPQVGKGIYYVPDRLPAPMPRHDGTFYGIAGISCAIVAILFLPPLYGMVGLICGILALKKGEVLFGFSAVVLSSLGMIVGIGLYLFTDAHPEFMYMKQSASDTEVTE